MDIRRARGEDIPVIMEILEQGRLKMVATGNPTQWKKGYPARSTVESDIERGVGYIIENENVPQGYFAFIPSPDPTYATIYDGAWLEDEGPYHVIHRIASVPGAHGIFAAIMDFASGFPGGLRIDTHEDNKVMQHNILKYGFSYCGIIHIANGEPRLAYQRLPLRYK